MRPDTRFNLLFVAGLLAVSAPGLFLLVRKKMSEPPARGMAAPPHDLETNRGWRSATVAYMDPTPGRVGATRVAPRETVSFVASLASKMAGQVGARVLAGVGEPVTSRRHDVELAALGQTADGRWRVGLVAWGADHAPIPENWTFPEGTAIESTLAQNLPLEVRGELADLFNTEPPARAVWLGLVLPPGALPSELAWTYTNGRVTFRDALDLSGAHVRAIADAVAAR